jgi:hypothetical protein
MIHKDSVGRGLNRGFISLFAWMDSGEKPEDF